MVTKASLRAFLRTLNQERRTTIVLTTHDLQDIEALCSRVMVIDHGKVVHDGDLDGLRTRFGGGKKVAITLKSPAPTLPDLPGAVTAWHRGDDLHLIADLADSADIPAVLARCLAALPVADIRIEEPDIEDVVKALYAGRS